MPRQDNRILLTKQSCWCTIPVARPQIQLEKATEVCWTTEPSSWINRVSCENHPPCFCAATLALWSVILWNNEDSHVGHELKLTLLPNMSKNRKVGHLFFSEFWSPKRASIKKPNDTCFLRWGPIFQLQTPHPHRIWGSCGAAGVTLLPSSESIWLDLKVQSSGQNRTTWCAMLFSVCWFSFHWTVVILGGNFKKIDG